MLCGLSVARGRVWSGVKDSPHTLENPALVKVPPTSTVHDMVYHVQRCNSGVWNQQHKVLSLVNLARDHEERTMSVGGGTALDTSWPPLSMPVTEARWPRQHTCPAGSDAVLLN